MFSDLEGLCEASTVCDGQVAAWLEDRIVSLQSPGPGNLLVNEM